MERTSQIFIGSKVEAEKSRINIMQTVAFGRRTTQTDRSDSDLSDSKIPIHYTSSTDKTDREYDNSPQMKNPKKVLKIDLQHTYIPHYSDPSEVEESDYFLSEVVDKDPVIPILTPTIIPPTADENISIKSTLSSSSAKFERALEKSVKSIVASVSNSSLAEDVRNNLARVFSTTKIAESSSSTNLPTIITRTNSTATILCVLEDPAAEISCRSFEDLNQSHHCIPVYIVLPAFRIVHDHDTIRDYPEYQIQLTIDKQKYTRWKRFDDFRSLGDACTAYYHYLQTREHSEKKKRRTRNAFYFGSQDMFRYFDDQEAAEEEAVEAVEAEEARTRKIIAASETSSKKTGKKDRKKESTEERVVITSQSLQQTVKAWQEVLIYRPWWRIQPYDLYALKAESIRLENFLKHVLFEIPNMAMLLEFMQ